MNQNILEITNDSDTIIVSFAGGIKKHQTQQFEFLSVFSKYYPMHSQLFINDKKKYRYHQGIDGVTKNIDETTEYLRKKISGYKKVYFVGISAGGYAAILFGSLLNINGVIAFVPPTLCNMKNDSRCFDPMYTDLEPLINKVTQYYLYADTSIKDELNSHHMSHCTRLNCYSNVTIYLSDFISLRSMRDSGELKKILNKIIK